MTQIPKKFPMKSVKRNYDKNVLKYFSQSDEGKQTIFLNFNLRCYIIMHLLYYLYTEREKTKFCHSELKLNVHVFLGAFRQHTCHEIKLKKPRSKANLSKYIHSYFICCACLGIELINLN